MNKIYLIGNLTRDPELSQTPNGIAVCKFALAVTRRFSNAEGERETDFFNVVAWRGLGETCHKYLKKGNKACITGSIQIRQYDAQDGTKRTAVEVVAEDVEFLTPKGAASEIVPDEDVPELATAKPPKKTASSKARSIADLEPVEDDGQLPF